MIGTEFLKGQGLGNQLFCYVSSRCIAGDLGYSFGTAGQGRLGVNIHSQKGLYFMDLDLGTEITDPDSFARYEEAEERLYLPDSVHDLTHGCYVAGADEGIYGIGDDTLLYGNLQSQRYFVHRREEVRRWLRVKPEYDSHEFTRDNLCILNLRGGEYVDCNELFLPRSYWLNAMKHMRSLRPDMEFMIVTDDVDAAAKVLPELPARHFTLDKDYATIKNAAYLIVSNSSFAFFPAFTSDTVRRVIAPKYWARYNRSNGYWASEQNIYDNFIYMDRKGRLTEAPECRAGLEQYRQSSAYRKAAAGGMAESGRGLTGRAALRVVAARERYGRLLRKAEYRLRGRRK